MPPWDDEEDLLDDDDLLADEEEEEWVGLGEEGRPGFRGALFSSQAACYAKFRPHYPQQVYDRIYAFAGSALGYDPGRGSQEVAIDVGCGPGSVAIQLAKKYAQVIGVDASQAQLDHAYQAPNVRYLCSAAEYLGEFLPPRSVDLIAMAETLHWVDHVPFYEQCRKILKPTGVVTIWCYDLNEFVAMGPEQDQAGVDKANALMRAFCYGMMGPFWDERRVHIDRHYVGLEPRPNQFRTCIREDDMNMEHILSMNHFMGYLASWSPYAAYRATYPDKEDPLIDLRMQFKKLLKVEDDDAPSLRISWPIFFLLIRDPVQDPEPVQQLLTGGRLVARDPSASQPLPPPPGRLARSQTVPIADHNTL